LDQAIKKKLAAAVKADEKARRLTTIPGNRLGGRFGLRRDGSRILSLSPTHAAPAWRHLLRLRRAPFATRLRWPRKTGKSARPPIPPRKRASSASHLSWRVISRARASAATPSCRASSTRPCCRGCRRTSKRRPAPLGPSRSSLAERDGFEPPVWISVPRSLLGSQDQSRRMNDDFRPKLQARSMMRPGSVTSPYELVDRLDFVRSAARGRQGDPEMSFGLPNSDSHPRRQTHWEFSIGLPIDAAKASSSSFQRGLRFHGLGDLKPLTFELARVQGALWFRWRRLSIGSRDHSTI
jgi:hypothetical protein